MIYPEKFPVQELSAQITGPCLFATAAVTQVDLETKELVDNLYDEAGQYCEAISQGIKAFHTAEYPSNDLMRYFKLPDDPETEAAVKEKVRSACVDVAAVGKILYTKVELDLAADLTSWEMYAFVEQMESQFRDGWGAEFELVDIPAGEDCVCLRLSHNGLAFCKDMAMTKFQQPIITEASPQVQRAQQNTPKSKKTKGTER